MKLRHLAAGAAAASLVGLSGPAIAAGPPYTVAVGGSTSGTQAVTAVSSGTVQFSARNSAGTIINGNCTSVSGNGTVTKGTGLTQVATIDSMTWTGCRTPFGPVAVAQSGTWVVNGTGSNATAGTETIAGYVGNVTAGVATTPSTICSFTVTGQASASFDEATQTLKISETGYTGNLTLSGVSGCLGQLQNGNPANFVANLNINTGGAGAINLS